MSIPYMYPEGWLIDPNGRWLLLFYKDSMCWGTLPKVYMDKWSSTEAGTPQSLKSSRKVDLGPAVETWNELIQNGWRKVDGQFEEAA